MSLCPLSQCLPLKSLKRFFFLIWKQFVIIRIVPKPIGVPFPQVTVTEISAHLRSHLCVPLVFLTCLTVSRICISSHICECI